MLKPFWTFGFIILYFLSSAQAYDKSYLEPENLAEEQSSSASGDISIEEAWELYLKQGGQLQQKSLFGNDYNILGSYHSYISAQCHYISLSGLLNKHNAFTSDLASDLQSWIHKCQYEISRFREGAIKSLVHFATVNYPLTNNKKLKHIEFRYDKGRSVARAIIGIKDNKRRPLVIIKNGLYGEANEETVSKNFFMHLFDESPFNVLLLGNMTGKDFIVDNARVALGGYDEGKQIHEIMDQLLSPNSPYRDLIEDIHMIGVSLGGNAALFSSLYSSHRRTSQPRLKSVMAVCPVVNLQNSFSHVFSNSIVGVANGVMAQSLVHNVFESVPILGQFLKRGKFWTKSDVSNAIIGSATTYYINRTHYEPWDMAPFENDILNSKNDVWKRNDFLAYTNDINIPTLILHSDDDPIVRDQDNAKLLKQSLQNKSSHVGVVNFKHGGHCGYNVSNGWPTMSTMLREFILKNSDYTAENVSSYGDLIYYHNTKEEEKNLADLKFVKYEWSAMKKAPIVNLKISFFDPNKKFLWFKLCDSDYRTADHRHCYYSKTYKLSLDSFKKFGLKVPTTDYETNKLSRWLNTHITPVTDKYEYAYGLTTIPTKFYTLEH